MQANDRKKQLLPLTSFRFFAALAIFFHHGRGYFLDISPQLPLAQGVSFFFVLSGFILFYVYGEKITSLDEFGRFFRARIARIYPVYLVSLFFFVFCNRFLTAPYFQKSADIFSAQFICNVLMLQSLVPLKEFFFSFNGPSWSISTEYFFYLAFFFLAYKFSKNWYVKVFITFFFLQLVIATASSIGVNKFFIYVNPLTRVFEFCWGMCICLLYNKTSAAVEKIRPSIMTVVEFLLVLTLLLSYSCYDHVLHLFQTISSFVFFNVPKNSNLFLIYGILILCFAYGRGFLSRILCHRSFVLLGELSFALYLYHQTILSIGKSHMYISSAFMGSKVIYLFFLLAITLAISAISYFLLERPARLLITRPGAWRQTNMFSGCCRVVVPSGVFLVMACLFFLFNVYNPPSTIFPLPNLNPNSYTLLDNSAYKVSLSSVSKRDDGNYKLEFEITSQAQQNVSETLNVVLLDKTKRPIASRRIVYDYSEAVVGSGLSWLRDTTFLKKEFRDAKYMAVKSNCWPTKKIVKINTLPNTLFF